ncbi:ABC transporter ATP-binding protein [Saprospira grandis]|uniref:ABC transporter related protein n=1 Tax=Saprospira grandis (strain Lewin) TaxID=984262 RepID=H6L708_SAPGL|nr:ABC transporter ATP-binding protein [Saprospira grandis]AFC26438.1 ABC transporter related protein [Saprospira grandis str. Lewin]
MRELAYLNKYFYKYRWRFLLGVLFVLASNYFRVLQPQVIRYALDLVIDNVYFYRLLEGSRLQADFFGQLGKILLFFGGLTLLFALLMGLFMYFMRQTLIVMSRLIERDLRQEIFQHYERLHLAFYRKNNTGDLMARLTEDVSKVRMYLGPAVMYGVNLVFLMVMVIGAMLSVSVELTLYSLIPLPILSFSIYYVTSIINKKSEAIQGQLSTINSLAQEVYSGIRVVKSYGREEAMADFFDEEIEDYKEKSLSLVRVEAMFRPLMIILIGASTIISVLVGGMLVIDGKISAGNIAEFIIYINMLTWPVTSIGWVASIVQRAAASQKRINEFLKTTVAVEDEAQGQTAPPLKGAIEFKDVSFRYPDTGILALKGLNFSLKAGERMAIIGRTGSGKSTIADLLLRMYDIDEGQILVDGQSIRAYPLDQLRQQIAYVPQDVFLFSDTISNNIAFGAPGKSQEEIEQAARYAAVYEDIMSLDQGFASQVGERGVTLSGGQKQRVSLARALIKDPSLLLLDDCLSAVDTKTEAEITQYLKTVCADKTTIIITHRLYASLAFDKIMVLEEGQVVEMGSHEELIAKKEGYYYELYEKQRVEELEK